MEIPSNNFNDENDVEKITNEILNYMKSWGCGYARAIEYPQETLKKVLDKFKEKGYYCYYLRRFDGVWIELQVCKKPQQCGGGYNQLIRY